MGAIRLGDGEEGVVDGFVSCVEQMEVTRCVVFTVTARTT